MTTNKQHTTALGFTRGEIDQAITQSDQLLAELVPGNCRREHVTAYCNQAPIARYMACACAGGEERNPWTPELARKFVRLYRKGRLDPQMIVALAYQCGQGKALMGRGLGKALDRLSNEETLNELQDRMSFERQLIARDLVEGNFGTLANQARQTRLMVSLRNTVLAVLNDIKKKTCLMAADVSIPMVMRAICMKNGLIDLHDCKGPLLKEIASNVLYRHYVFSHSEELILDIWGLSLVEILEAVVDRSQQAQAACDAWGVEYSPDPCHLTPWLDGLFEDLMEREYLSGFSIQNITPQTD